MLCKEVFIFLDISGDVLLLIFRNQRAPECFPIYSQVFSGPQKGTPEDPPLHHDIVYGWFCRRLASYIALGRFALETLISSFPSTCV